MFFPNLYIFAVLRSKYPKKNCGVGTQCNLSSYKIEVKTLLVLIETHKSEFRLKNCTFCFFFTIFMSRQIFWKKIIHGLIFSLFSVYDFLWLNFFEWTSEDCHQANVYGAGGDNFFFFLLHVCDGRHKRSLVWVGVGVVLSLCNFEASIWFLMCWFESDVLYCTYAGERGFGKFWRYCHVFVSYVQKWMYKFFLTNLTPIRTTTMPSCGSSHGPPRVP